MLSFSSCNEIMYIAQWLSTMCLVDLLRFSTTTSTSVSYTLALNQAFLTQISSRSLGPSLAVRNNPGKESLGLRLQRVYHSGEAILTLAQLLTSGFCWERKFHIMIEAHPCPGEDLCVVGASGKGNGSLSMSSSHTWRAEAAHGKDSPPPRRMLLQHAASSSPERLGGRGRGEEEKKGGEGGEGEGGGGREREGREGGRVSARTSGYRSGDGELYHHKVVLSCTVATSRKLCDQLYCHNVSSLVSDPGHTHTDCMSQIQATPCPRL